MVAVLHVEVSIQQKQRSRKAGRRHMTVYTCRIHICVEMFAFVCAQAFS